MKIDLKNKTALITGAAGTIGSAISMELARNGAAVYMNDVNPEAGQKLTEAIAAEGYKAVFLSGDVTKEEDIRKIVIAAAEKQGSIDILVNNVGVNVDAQFRKPIYGYDPAQWRRVTDVCLDSGYYCCKYVMPMMAEKKYGKVVNIGSVAGTIAPLRLQSPYSAAKAAIANLTRSLAMEYAQYGINVNAVVPGSIMNWQIKALIYSDPARKESMMSHIPLGYPGEPLDIANAVLFLVSDESRYITGSILNVDGGWAAGYTIDFNEDTKGEKK
jgi:3-oxoacyl-[acyl-carrier protein] reductase